MKQFSLEEYLKNTERKVVTRDGRSVRIVCIDAKDIYGRPIVALVSYNDTKEDVYTFHENGRFVANEEDAKDLFFAPQIQKRWSVMILSIDITEHTLGSLFLYKTREEAEKHATGYPVVEITWEE